MTKENINADQLITTIIGGIEEVKGKDILLFAKVLLIRK
jgi:hypothetical protein